MNIDQLFCTPEQGKRLAELVPTVEPAMWWVDFDGEFEDYPYFKHQYVYEYGMREAPALTLQELRDVAKGKVRTTYMPDLGHACEFYTAPELAAWVIERLEGVEP